MPQAIMEKHQSISATNIYVIDCHSLCRYFSCMLIYMYGTYMVMPSPGSQCIQPSKSSSSLTCTATVTLARIKAIMTDPFDNVCPKKFSSESALHQDFQVCFDKDFRYQLFFGFLVFCTNLSFLVLLLVCLVFWKRMPMGSNESIPRPGSLFQQNIIARLLLRLSFLGTPS